MSRGSTVANWFYVEDPLEPAHFALDLTDLADGCPGFRDALPGRTRYLSAQTLVPTCNYNEGLLPKLPKDLERDTKGVVVALGVLEQVCDLPSFLEGLKSYYRPLVVSYAPVDSKRVNAGNRANALTTSQWRAMLSNLTMGSPRHEARVSINGNMNFVYWFEPDNWTPFAK